MTRMGLSGYGLCRTPDGRTVLCNPPPVNQPSGNGLAQLALMLRGSGWLDQADAAGRDEEGTAYPSPSTNSSGSAYGNNWAATPSKVGPFDAGRHLPITKAQEVILPSMAEPWIETFPMYEPKPWDLPIPNEITPPPTAVPMPLEGEEGKYGPVPTEEECDREWAEAGRACRKKRDALQAQAGRRKVKFDVDRCAAGLVSEACGGNPVDWGRPRRSIRPYKPLQA